MRTANYDDIQRLLAQERSLTDAAEAHGMLSGALSMTTHYHFEGWLIDIIPEGATDPEFVTALQALYKDTLQAFAGTAMEFEPLLPDDQESIAARTTALGLWCRGFLQGFNANALLEKDDLPEDVCEVLLDFNEIIDVDVDSADSDEEAENAYAELVEFVRVGAQLVFDELQPLRAQEATLLN